MIKKHKLVWLGLFLLVGQIFVTNFVSPPSAYAASVDELRSRGRRIVKLEAFRLCVNEYLTNDGIDPGDGPFNLDFAVGDSLHAADKAVGHGIDGTDGRWDCGSDTGSREDAWFKLVLRNGSNTEYYTGWDDGDNGYADYGSKNIRNVVGDDHPDLYFINSSNKADYDMDVEKDAVTGRAANKKLFAQIDRSIKKQEEGLTKDDKSAMRYIMLSDTFFSPTGCAAKEADPNDGGDKVKIGNVNYTVNNDGQGAGSGEVAVGHGDYAWGDRGTTNCKSLGEQMGKLRKAYETATGNTSQQPPGSNPDETDGAGDNGEIEFQCSVSINPLTWFMCPLITAFAGTVNALDGAINDRLLIETDHYLGDSSSCSIGDYTTSDCDVSGGFRKVWTNVRNIALALLIVIGLIMVISTAIGVGPFDAYTVKKLMPRILMAIIGISLSWTFVKFAIDVTNSLGLAVRSLIQSPFKDVFEEGVKLDGGQLSLGSLGVVGVGMSLGIWGVLSLAGTAALAVMVAFAVLVIRQMLVVLLAVLAPVAIVAYILPNTKKMGSLWWDFFSKALLVFPIISAFIAIGRVFAVVGRQVDDGLMGTFITFVAYFGPYFALPTAFRLAGGAIAQIGGIANDRSKGAFDRLSKFRAGKSQERIKNFRAQGQYSEDTKRGRVGNKIGGYLFDSDERVPYALGKTDGKLSSKTGRALFGGTSDRIGSKIEHARMEQTKKQMEEWNNAGMANDKSYRLITGRLDGLSEGVVKKLKTFEGGRLYDEKNGRLHEFKSMADFEAVSHIMQDSTEHTERVAGDALHRLAPMALNRHRNGLGYGDLRGSALLGLAAHGFANEDDLNDTITAISDTDGGNNAFADAIGVQAELYGKSAGLKAGYTHGWTTVEGPDGKKRKVSLGARASGRDWELAGSETSQDLAGMKSGAVKRRAKTWVEMIEYAGKVDKARAGDMNAMNEVSATQAEWRRRGYSEATIKSRTELAVQKAASLENVMNQLAGDFSYAPTDTSAAVREVMTTAGLTPRGTPDPRAVGLDPTRGQQPPTPGGPGPAPPPGGGFTPPSPPMGGAR